MTGLPNRVQLHRSGSPAAADRRPEQRKVAVLFIDLDHFK